MTTAPTNLLLAMFPAPSRLALMKTLEPVALPVRTLLYQPEKPPPYIHFITSGMASVVTNMTDGDVAEVGIIGHEGIAEGLHLLGPALVQTSCFMQIGGTGLRMKFHEFEQQFVRNESLLRPCLRFVQYQSLILGQVAACNRLHEVEQRLARWLLMVADRVVERDLLLTQEFLAQMLGSRRSTVTLAAGVLQRSGLIDYNRGRVRITNRPGLEDIACECYDVTRDALRRYLNTPASAAIA